MEKKYTISIVEDNEDYSLAIREFINRSENYSVLNVYESYEEMNESFPNEQSDIILMDIDLPGINGIEGTRLIKKDFPNVQVIVVTVFENSESVFSALRSGATGYLTKTLNQEELVSALDECVNGGAPMSMKIAKMVVSSFKLNNKSPLTERETEIISCLSMGMSYSTTADKLFISKETVKYHIKNIYIKLQVNTKEEAIRVANKEKYI